MSSALSPVDLLRFFFSCSRDKACPRSPLVSTVPYLEMGASLWGDKANLRYNLEGGELHETLNLNNCVQSSMAVIIDEGFSTTISSLNS